MRTNLLKILVLIIAPVIFQNLSAAPCTPINQVNETLKGSQKDRHLVLQGETDHAKDQLHNLSWKGYVTDDYHFYLSITEEFKITKVEFETMDIALSYRPDTNFKINIFSSGEGNCSNETFCQEVPGRLKMNEPCLNEGDRLMIEYVATPENRMIKHSFLIR